MLSVSFVYFSLSVNVFTAGALGLGTHKTPVSTAVLTNECVDDFPVVRQSNNDQNMYVTSEGLLLRALYINSCSQ